MHHYEQPSSICPFEIISRALGRELLKLLLLARRGTSSEEMLASASPPARKGMYLPAGRLAPGMSLKGDAETAALPERSSLLDSDPCKAEIFRAL
jgi:hypothetical protein